MATQAGTVAPLVRGSFRSELFRQGLFEVFGLGVESVESRIGQFFHRETSNQNYEEMMSMAGIGQFGLWPERSTIQYQTISNRYKSIFRHLDYATGIVYSRLVKRDLKYGIIREAARQFGMSAASTQEMLAADFFNTGFTTAWNAEENLPFFSAAHLLDPRKRKADGTQATYSNLVDGDLSISTLQTAITRLLLTPNDMGYPMHIRARKLIVHPEKEWLARSILESPGEYVNANNAVNTLKGKLQIVTWEYLTNTNAWFIQGDYYRTYWFDRETLQQDTEDDFDSGDIKHKAWFSTSCGAADWRGWIGSTGG